MTTTTTMPCTVGACPNERHDHYGENEYGDTIALTCDGCGRPLHYDYDIEDYRHDDRVAECFLVAPQVSGPRAELAALGVTDEQMDTVTGFGLRRNGRCLPDDTIVNKYAAEALSRHGVMMVLFGSNSPQHCNGSAL
jgi:hypothetical protein